MFFIHLTRSTPRISQNKKLGEEWNSSDVMYIDFHLHPKFLVFNFVNPTCTKWKWSLFRQPYLKPSDRHLSDTQVCWGSSCTQQSQTAHSSDHTPWRTFQKYSENCQRHWTNDGSLPDVLLWLKYWQYLKRSCSYEKNLKKKKHPRFLFSRGTVKKKKTSREGWTWIVRGTSDRIQNNWLFALNLMYI